MRLILGVELGEQEVHVVAIDSYQSLMAGVSHRGAGRPERLLSKAIAETLRVVGAQAREIQYCAVVSDHCSRALRQRRGLARVALLRLADPAGSAIPPLFSWPHELVEAIGGSAVAIAGGVDLDGRPIGSLPDEGEILEVIRRLKGSGSEALAVTGIFSPVHPQSEVQMAARIREAMGPDFPILLSHWLGPIGFLERENAAVLNTALIKVGPTGGELVARVLQSLGAEVPIFVAQNDGTLMSLAQTRRFPLLTVRSVVAHLLRGAVHLSGRESGLVLCSGPETVELGLVEGGFPHESTRPGTIEGVRVNVALPEILSIPITAGHGGWTDGMTERVERLLVQIKGHAEPVPVIMAGPLADQVPQQLRGVLRAERLTNVAWSAAIGAAMAPLGGRADGTYSLETWSHEGARAEAVRRAADWAVAAGADPASVQVVGIDETPFTYLPGNVLRIRAKVAGKPLIAEPATLSG